MHFHALHRTQRNQNTSISAPYRICTNVSLAICPYTFLSALSRWQGRSNWPLELPWLRWGARNWPLDLARPRWGARNLPLEPASAWLENTAPAEKCRYLLHMAARAWPGAADGSKWPLEPAPAPQMARNGRSSPPRGRRWLEYVAARAWPGAADGSKRPLEPAPGPPMARPEPQNTRRVPLEPALEPQTARRAPLEPPRNRRMRDGCRSSLP